MCIKFRSKTCKRSEDTPSLSSTEVLTAQFFHDENEVSEVLKNIAALCGAWTQTHGMGMIQFKHDNMENF